MDLRDSELVVELGRPERLGENAKRFTVGSVEKPVVDLGIPPEFLNEGGWEVTS